MKRNKKREQRGMLGNRAGLDWALGFFLSFFGWMDGRIDGGGLLSVGSPGSGVWGMSF